MWDEILMSEPEINKGENSERGGTDSAVQIYRPDTEKVTAYDC
jgi:hypothetical protein